MDPSLEDHKRHVKNAIRTIEQKIQRPEFQERLTSEGHIIAREFLDDVRWGLNVMDRDLGRLHPEHVELCEAVAMIGSGCLRWAMAKTRILISNPQFRRNQTLYNIEKVKIEKAYELINVFSNMVGQDPGITQVVLEVRDIIFDLHKMTHKRFGLFSRLDLISIYMLEPI